MIISDLKPTKDRFNIEDMGTFGIQSFGQRNDYPQKAISLVNSSPTAKTCLERYAKFIRGGGVSVDVYKMKVNQRQKFDAFLRDLSNDLAFGTICIHVNYNIFGEITEVQTIPFEMCRLGLPDESGYVSKIAVHPDWLGKRKNKPNKNTIDYIDVYNPLREVVLAQIEKVGIENYKGQILYISSNGINQYGTPIFDSAFTDISTDEGLANVRCRNVKNNFLPYGMFVYKRGANGEDGSGFDVEMMKSFQGDTEANKIMSVGVDFPEEEPKFIRFDIQNFDKEFTATKEATTEEIYAAFGQEVFYRIRTGALGFANDIIQEAFNYYNVITTDERYFLEEILTEIFTHFVKKEIKIIPLTYAEKLP